MRIWRTEVYTAQGNLLKTYYFYNIADATQSIRNTWSKQPNEIRETKMSEEHEHRHLWVYAADHSRVAVDIKRIDVEILDHAIHF